MPPIAPSISRDLSARFTLIAAGLRRACAVRMRQYPAIALILMLVATRLQRATARFASLASLAGRAGAAGAKPVGSPRPAPRPRRRPDPACAPSAPPRLPRGSGWLIRLVGSEAACSGSQLQHLLAEPEMGALLAAAPGIGRILRPLCRMLAVPLPASLAPSRTQAPPRRPPPRPPRRPAEPSAAEPPARRRRPQSVRALCALAGIPPPARA